MATVMGGVDIRPGATVSVEVARQMVRLSINGELPRTSASGLPECAGMPCVGWIAVVRRGV